jgi:RNA polymerase sigma-70 factor (ECF subfamily)
MAPTDQTRTRARTEQSPEELAVRAQSGSLAAFSELVDRFEVRLYNFLLRRVGSATDAEDLTQETFLRAWLRIGSYRPRWRFSTWLFTIGARLAVSHARRSPRRTEPMRPDAPARPAGLADRLSQSEQRSRIWSLVGELLTPEQQTAVWLRYVEDMAVKDIATVMGRTQVSVRVMLFRTRAVLAEHLDAPSDPDRNAPTPQPRPPALRGVS